MARGTEQNRKKKWRVAGLPQMKVKSDAIKNNITWEPGMLRPRIKENSKWSNRRYQERASTF